MARPSLVTGGTGFAGSHLIEHLLEREPTVAAWGNPAGRGVPAGTSERIAWSTIDLLDASAVTRAIREIQPVAIYHCGGIADVHSAWSDSARALRINALGTHHLLEAVRAARLDATVLVTGSALVYRQSDRPLSEDSPIGPSSPYGVSKLAQEMLATRARWCRVMIVRPFNHAGPRQSASYVTSSFARQIAEIEAGLCEPVLRVGNLESRRDITDVRDTARAYRLLVERGRPGYPYNVCSGQAYRVADLMEALISKSKTTIRTEIDAGRLRPSDTPIIVGSYARLEAETGWQPRISIDQTLSDLLDYWRGVTDARGATRS